MNQLQFADDIAAPIRARGDRYHERGYIFVLGAIGTSSRGSTSGGMYRAENWRGRAATSRSTNSDYLLRVLEHWGITSTGDIGRMVFTLVDVGLLVTQPGDDAGSEFNDVFTFPEAFGGAYRWRGMTGA